MGITQGYMDLTLVDDEREALQMPTKCSRTRDELQRPGRGVPFVGCPGKNDPEK